LARLEQSLLASTTPVKTTGVDLTVSSVSTASGETTGVDTICQKIHQ
jgi:hypothetical protein